ncbi:MAG TPA: SpoIIE family protein phosphatase [Thermoanaerobaculia bacterium]|nr:SpoIIE family protein phosphatase [Thermoanaerobaculia bacterium]
MNPMVVEPVQKRRRLPPAFLVWLAGIGTIIGFNLLDNLLGRFDRSIGLLGIFSFFAWLLVIGLTLYGFAVATRWLLQQLFWTVGRRLFLSYLLVGVMPFVLMTVLLLTVSYMFAGVMTQATLRGERQASLGQMETWALEYGITGGRISGTLPSFELYDTANASGARLPEWLRRSSFSGVVERDGTPLLVAARQFPTGDPSQTRSVVLVQPLDRHWTDALYEKTHMVARTSQAQASNGSLTVDGNDAFKEVLANHLGSTIIWGDITSMARWTDGRTEDAHGLFTLIANPPSNLLSYYLGTGDSGSRYFRILMRIVFGMVTMLMILYAIAALFAMVLIFSISRAVNRIEKGTRAVERGDFSYRIKMKRHNQLGAMAQSFDSMTASIASLLSTVSEKERLQSEIEIAATIQRNLLPKEGPKFRGVSFSAHFEPTTSIGGDYYDVFNLDKSRLAVAIGDVSGHGLSTGLVMAMVKAAITTLVEEGADETSLFKRLNELVYRSTERRAFMTLAFTIFDLERGTVRHTNAGHLYPYLLRNDTSAPISVECPSLPLGVREHMTTRTVEVPLREGDSIVYLSDGIVEAQDENGDPLGFEQLEGLLGAQVDRTPGALRDVILEAVARHSGTRPADDDRTVMVLRFDHLLTAAADTPHLVVAEANA